MLKRLGCAQNQRAAGVAFGLLPQTLLVESAPSRKPFNGYRINDH